MPRPGPRPYECVRRAWHSDTHQPIRGSLIQEIFRIANEIHSPATKKKKEWQEKLPIVVLKAEEIIYSKAISQDDYMDLKTLWSRVNDAINTIIRRDESSEDTAEFLQPCIEAALHLGCIPRRTSRSQRNNHPRGYLTGNPDFNNVAEGSSKPTSSLAPHCSNFRGKEPQILAPPLKNWLNAEPFFSNPNGLLPSYPPKSYALYPLHYGACPQPIRPQPKLPASKSTRSDLPEKEMPRKFPRCSEDNPMNRTDQPKLPSNPPVEECDLSLRLGFSSMQQDENTRTHLDGMNIAASKHIVKERNFLFNDSKAHSRDENLGVDFMARKRKAVDFDQMKDPRHSLEPRFF